MPNGSLPPTGAKELDGSTQSISSIHDDFTALVAIFEQQLELVPASDQESRTHLLNAKTAAERGAALTQKLMR